MTPRLHVPAIGGPHQFAHFLPIAFELAARGSANVTIFVPTQQDKQDLTEFARSVGMALPPTIIMDLPDTIERIVPAQMEKLARLLTWASRLRDCEAILCAERTSTILKRLPGRCPPLIHIPHGAGDRAVGFEKRFRLFDQVLVAGPKDRERLIAEGVVSEGACTVSGPIKVASVLKAHNRRPAIFANDRPVILYNPHFSPHHSSAETFTRRLASAIVDDGRYNLIIAPHIRMAQHWDAARRADWQAMAVADRVLVDLGSPRSIDMTYTLGADLYIGDVSSQVYEFLVRPRPCLFINAHDADWEDSESYAMWRFGEVVPANCDIPAAIDRAFKQHDLYRQAQVTRARAALHGLDWDSAGNPLFSHGDPVANGASFIEAYMQNHSVERPPQSIPFWRRLRKASA